MARKEAIEHIKDIICENNTIKPNITVFEQEKEALYMAISDMERVEKLEIENKKLLKDYLTMAQDIVDIIKKNFKEVKDE